MAEQLVFDLPVRPAMGRGDFFVSGSNAVALAQVEGWRDWPHGKLVLTGPSGAGKTHLAHVWATQTGARIIAASDITERDVEPLGQSEALAIEDMEAVAGDRAAETRLFHIHNALTNRGAPMLFTAGAPPARWGLCLPDLDSRMGQAGLAALDPPDDALLAALILKLAHDRALPLTPAILSHVAPRIERAFAAAQAFVERLDARALSRQRPPRLIDAKAVLAELEAGVSRSRHDT
ncbi:DnaA/Hda family protein [Roseibacterium sp. SDUM158016]|uniref:DnaA ATPase domain-containing protein n=1 Tax=Roseicyclus sediminis TaxID=2980997 RepID=UPI0021CF6B8F|nr:DnaA/Hda family protein [Roseibacterium sp. SDUM158016]MCU4654853.1 DnaA/Hda family protein [Roseibacterium sp. SDUM158016]